jgi:hypothetical protein
LPFHELIEVVDCFVVCAEGLFIGELAKRSIDCASSLKRDTAVNSLSDATTPYEDRQPRSPPTRSSASDAKAGCGSPAASSAWKSAFSWRTEVTMGRSSFCPTLAMASSAEPLSTSDCGALDGAEGVLLDALTPWVRRSNSPLWKRPPTGQSETSRTTPRRNLTRRTPFLQLVAGHRLHEGVGCQEPHRLDSVRASRLRHPHPRVDIEMRFLCSITPRCLDPGSVAVLGHTASLIARRPTELSEGHKKAVFDPFDPLGHSLAERRPRTPARRCPEGRSPLSGRTRPASCKRPGR